MKGINKNTVQIPNLLLIAGNGRNVGKTFVACRLIRELSKHYPVTAVKISSHFHDYNIDDVVVKDENYVILKEKQITTKDSSRMLQSGAKQVYFIMATQEHLKQAFEEIQNRLMDHPVVCESGGLHEVITPGLFLFVNQAQKEIIKKNHLSFSPVIIENNGKELNFNLSSIQFNNNTFSVKP